MSGFGKLGPSAHPRQMTPYGDRRLTRPLLNARYFGELGHSDHDLNRPLMTHFTDSAFRRVIDRRNGMAGYGPESDWVHATGGGRL